MKFMIVFLYLLVSASAELHRLEQQNKQQIDPANDADAIEDIKEQMKRTVIGVGPYTYAANYGAAKHVGVHPLGFKYLLGYGPVGYVPVAKPAVTVLKPTLHTHGWKPIIPVQTVPVVRPLPLRPVVPFVPVHAKPHIVTPVQPVEKPLLQPVLPQAPAGTVPYVYPFYKHLVPVQHPVLQFQPPLVQQFVPQVHLQPPLLQPQTPVVPVQQPVVPVQQPVVPQTFIPQQLLPVQPHLFHFLKHLPQGPYFKQITPLIPVHLPQLPVPELPKVPVHTPVTTHDTGVSVQIPTHLPDHPHFRPTVHILPPSSRPDFDDQGGQGQTPFALIPQQPDFSTGQQGETDTSFVFQTPQHQPTHPEPQTPLYLPPHPVFRPGVANPVGPVEPTNSVQTEFSATFPKHPFINSIQHPSISLEPPYGPNNHLG